MSDLFVDSWGTGTPVVLVHGSLATGGEEWHAQRPLADDGFRLLVLDRRGYGKSPVAEGEDFLSDADDIAKVMGDGAASGGSFLLRSRRALRSCPPSEGDAIRGCAGASRDDMRPVPSSRASPCRRSAPPLGSGPPRRRLGHAVSEGCGERSGRASLRADRRHGATGASVPPREGRLAHRPPADRASDGRRIGWSQRAGFDAI
jgi:hypothetical protein